MAIAAVLAFGALAIPISASASNYCKTDEGMMDPRCDPAYCEKPDNWADPYCSDPNYCLRYPDDPVCPKEPSPEDKKELCVWYVDGVPVGSVVPIFRQSNPGPHAVRLECPNHELADWDCVAKAREQGDIPATGIEDPQCEYHGAKRDPFTCQATFAWTVTVPDFNTWTVELRAVTYKVEPVADPTGLFGGLFCAGPVDWNTSNPPGIAPECVLENQFLAKDELWKQRGEWIHYHVDEETGEWSYHTHPNVKSMPDGKLDACDLQHYSVQWRQWN